MTVIVAARTSVVELAVKVKGEGVNGLPDGSQRVWEANSVVVTFFIDLNFASATPSSIGEGLLMSFVGRKAFLGEQGLGREQRVQGDVSEHVWPYAPSLRHRIDPPSAYVVVIVVAGRMPDPLQKNAACSCPRPSTWLSSAILIQPSVAVSSGCEGEVDPVSVGGDKPYQSGSVFMFSRCLSKDVEVDKGHTSNVHDAEACHKLPSTLRANYIPRSSGTPDL